MPLATYDPKKINIIVGGAIMTGFADGTFVNVERTSDTFSKKTGADGFTIRTKSNDLSGTIEITLLQSSPSNSVLSAIANLDETSNEGVVPVTIKDLLGNSLYVSANAWIRKRPPGGYAKEETSRTWILDCADLDIIVGGNV